MGARDETATEADGSMPAPGQKGEGKDGPMCSMADFITELVSGGLPGGDQSLDMNCISVGGLPTDTTPENLYQIFATFGPLLPRGARVDTVGGMGEECTGTGYVSF